MTISEVSQRTGITQDTLRYYERIGLIPKVKRRPNGIRDYSEEDCRWIELARCMRSAGVTIEALIEYCVLAQKGDATITARKELLMEERENLTAKIEEMQRALERLHYKIQRYEEAEKTGILSWERKAVRAL